MEESKEVEELQFKWGKKRGIGGKKKNIQFYESFTFDDEEYTLYDCVYTYKDDEPEPFIGKIIKIWEAADKERRVKLLWFFRPSDLSNCLKGIGRILENEIFLASGEGVGVANVNPLEAIAGKCKVVCILEDNRNPQPSDEEIKNADFVFHRVFDVNKCEVLEQIDEKVAGIEVKYIFNRPGCHKSNVMQKVEADLKTNAGNIVAEGQTGMTSEESGFGYKLGKESEGPKQLARQKSSVVELNSSKDSGELNDRPHKKQKLGGPFGASDDKNNKSFLNLNRDEEKNIKAVSPVGIRRDKVAVEKVLSMKPSFERKDAKAVTLVDHSRDAYAVERGLSKNRSFDDKHKKCIEDKASIQSSKNLTDEDKKPNYQVLEVTRRPDSERSKWFRKLPWEDTVQSAHDEGKLVLLQNLDPTYTSSEVEDIVFHGFNEKCDAKMIQRTAISIPHIGQALVIFKTREAAEKVVRRLSQGCLLLSNGRPLVGSNTKLCPQGKHATFPGHLVIDKLRLQTQREMRNGVSTSHCSQPNTLEYDMAMEWCLHQARFEGMWEKLFKQQGGEMRKLRVNLRSKLP